jgi:hypothetical protein
MSDHNFNIPPYSGSTYDWLEWSIQFLQCAQNASTIDPFGHGLLGFILTDTEYQALEFPTQHVPAPFTPATDPGPEPTLIANATAVQISAHVAQWNHWKHNNAAQQEQNADVQKFKRQALASLPKFVISFLRSPVHGTLRLSLRDIYQGMLAKLGTLSSADLDKNASQLTSPYTAGTAITDHIALQRQSHTVAQLNQQPFPEASKVKAFADSLSSCPQFQSRLDAWFIQYPAVANQTFDSLATAIELHSSSRHFHSTSSSTMGYAASILPAPPAPDIAAIVAAVQAAMKTARPAGRTSRTTSSGYRRSAGRDYCWTHGPGGHSSQVCEHKKPGHQDMATAANRMGGS